MNALLRVTTIAVISSFLASCGSTSTADPNARPHSPSDLPAESANLQFSGPIDAHITEVRVGQCASRKAGDFTTFYASIYFSVSGQWYYLELTGLNPLPVKGSPLGYAGPGLYSADADFREMTVNPGGMTSGDHAWGVPIDRMATLAVSPGEKSVSVGTVSGWSLPRPALSSSLDLWPKSPNASGPPPAPTPSADQVEHISGSWVCR